MTKKAIVSNWMDNYYDRNVRTIRAIWYQMKPTMQGHDITDTQAIRIIGQWLWERFVKGDNGIYGGIGHSQRVKQNRLPIILFCEKNTLEPFGGIEDYIYANSYLSSGQANLYEIANLVNGIGIVEEIYLYVATDFDKAGDDIANSLMNHLSKFYRVSYKRLEVDIEGYETYIQPKGETGLELDAIYDLQELVASDLEKFLPYELFREVAIEEQKDIVFEDAKSYDETHRRLVQQMIEREEELRDKVEGYQYDYCLQSPLRNLYKRVKVT